MNRKLNGKLVMIVRIVLFVLGAALGTLAVWQYFQLNPNVVVGGIKAVFYSACALVPALLMLFSTKPILMLAYAIGDLIKKAFGRTKPMDVASALLGLLIGLLLGYLCEALFSLVLKIFALRLIIDILVGLIFGYVSALLCSKLLSNKNASSDGLSEGERNGAEYGVTRLSIKSGTGYLLSASALYRKTLVPICEKWLLGTIFVSQKTVDLLMDDAANPLSAEAIVRYRALCESGKVRLINAKNADSDEKTELVCLAQNKRLKLIVASDEWADGVLAAEKNKKRTFTLLALNELGAEEKALL